MNWRICVLLVQLWFCCSVSQLYDEKYEGDDCELEGNVQGRCVQLSKCPSIIDIIQKQEHPITCGYNGFTPIVCCPVAEKLKTRLSEQKCLIYQKIQLKTLQESPITPLETKLVTEQTYISPVSSTEDPYLNWSENSTIDLLNQAKEIIRPDPQNENKLLINNESYNIEDLKTVHLDLREIFANTSNKNIEKLTNSEEVGTVYIRFNYTEDTSKDVQDPLNITILNITTAEDSNISNIQPDELSTNIKEDHLNISSGENNSVSTDSMIPTSNYEFDPSDFDIGDGLGIVSGVGARTYEFPHMVALGFSRGKEQLWRCGGSLVSEKFVLTAAHCLSSSDYGEIEWASLGTNYLNITPNYFQEIIKITRRIPHPLFKRPSTYHDIALVELDRPVEFSRLIRPACLPTSHEVDTQVQLIATGWGLTEFAGKASDNLQKVNLDVYSMQECGKVYADTSGTRRLRNGIVEEMQFCAGGRQGQQDTCNGDSGGPLQVKLGDNNEPIYSIIGVTSFGKSCGLQGVPGVYIRVAQYVPWLETIIWPNES